MSLFCGYCMDEPCSCPQETEADALRRENTKLREALQLGAAYIEAQDGAHNSYAVFLSKGRFKAALRSALNPHGSQNIAFDIPAERELNRIRPNLLGIEKL